jgi:hypothetical protein
MIFGARTMPLPQTQGSTTGFARNERRNEKIWEAATKKCGTEKAVRYW